MFFKKACVGVLLSFVALTNGVCVGPALAQRSLVLTLYNSGVKAYDRGDYREALRIFKQCEEMGASTPHTSQEGIQLLYSFGECLRCMGQYKEAEAVFKKALSAMEALPPYQQNYFWLFNGLALLYQSQGRFAEAEGLWKQCELMTHRGDPNLLYPVNNLARHYFMWGKLTEEREYLEKAGRIAEHSRESLAVPYWRLNLAQYAEQRGLHQEAEQNYKQALESCSTVCGANHPYCGFILIGLAELYRKQGRYTEAERSLLSAQKIFEARYCSDHPDISETMVRLGKVLSEEGRYSQARELVTRALKTEVSLLGTEESLFVARAKNCLGNIYRQDGRYSEAHSLLNQALETQKRILGIDNLEVAVTMRDLALVNEEEANYQEAENLLSSSLSIIEKQTGPDHCERALGVNALAHAYLRDEKFDEAEPLFKRALELSERTLGLEHAITAANYRDLGQLYLKQKRFSEAESFLDKSLNVDEKLHGEKAPQVAADLSSLASAYAAQGQAQKAEPLLQRAAVIQNLLPGGRAGTIELPEASVAMASDRPVTGKWALVIGISNFKDSSINLKYAAKDATDFSNFLINKERFRADHVKLLTDESASRESIIGMLGDKWLASHVHPDDLVVVYISSHGSSATTEAGGTNFLVAHDTNKNSLLATGIPMQWLTSIVSEQVHSNRVILILDVCHSGAVSEGQKALTRAAGIDVRAIKFGRGQMILCSSLSEQVSWESKSYENSVFTRCLMEALQSRKEETTLLDAYKQLKVLVESEVLRDRGTLQTPLLVNKHWLGKDPMLAVEPLVMK